jgi:Tfp pilus assembly protein PilN
MTATLSPNPASIPERSLRMLAISANLLPEEVTDARRTRKIRLVVASAVAGLAAVVAAWYGLAAYQTAAAESEVAALQDRAASLRSQQNQFTELAGVQTQSTAIEAELRKLMRTDQRWADLLTAAEKAAPAGVKLMVVNATATSGKPVSGAAAAAANGGLPNTSGQTLAGTLTLTGSAPDKPAVAAYVTALRKATGVVNVELVSATKDDQGRMSFTVDAAVSTKLAGTRFTPQGGK